MSDTVRSQAQLLAMLAPTNVEVNGATVLISQAARDLIVSLPGLTASAANYNFPALTPPLTNGDANRTLTAGQAATIRLDRVPSGINGTDANHYLYISGGSGTAEAVLITGGTAVSDGSNQTLTFTPANNHSGAWTVQSASGGIVEAGNSNPNQLIQLSQGSTHIYASVAIPNACPGVVGNGSLQSYIAVHFTASSIFTINTAVSVYFARFQILPQSGNMTAGAAIDLVAAASVTCADIFFGGSGVGFGVYIGVRCVGPAANRVYLTNCWIVAEFRGLHIDTAYLSIQNVQVLTARTASTFISAGAALYLKSIAGTFINGFIHDQGIFAYGILVDTGSGGNVNEVEITNLYLDNWSVAGIGIIGTGAAASWTISSFRIVDDNGLLATSVAGYGLILPIAGVVGWQLSAGSILYAYGYGVLVSGAAVDVRLVGVDIHPVFTFAGNGAFVVNGGPPSEIALIGCALGSSINGGTAVTTYGFISNQAIAGLTIVGCTIAGDTQPDKLTLAGTETNVQIASNNGINTAAKSVTAAASLAFPVMDQNDVLIVTGNTNITAVSGLREGQTGILICTGTPAWTNGSTIGSSTVTLSANVPGKFAFTGSKLYVSA